MRILISIIVFSIVTISCSKDEDEELRHCWALIDNTWELVELSKMPIYMDGSSELIELIFQEIRYPAEARENDIEGIVRVQYEVTVTGEVEDRIILEDIGGGCGDEVIRVLELITQGEVFESGEYEGQAVRVRKEHSITFKLQ